MTKEQILAEFQTMNKEHWSYRWGAAEYGCVDCSGAFVYAYKQYGRSIYHGSNTIAREYVLQIMPISEAKPGMAAFKARNPAANGYDLPDKFEYHPDQLDYYHIGLIDDDPRYVLNAQSTSTGFQRSPISQNWTHCAYLKGVDYGDIPKEEDKPMQEKATVTATSGSTVNMRVSPSTSAKLVERVPVGSQVTILEDRGQWCKIAYGSKEGWMLSNYLDYDGSPDDTNNESEYQQAINQIAPLVIRIQEIIDQLQGGVG